jgi:hypothetical protein
LRDEQESNESGRHDRKEPGRDLGRNRLERGHIAPLPAMLMKVDGLLPEQRPISQHSTLIPMRIVMVRRVSL